MLQPGRTYTNGSGYRYGFNGKENDNEVKGEGNSIDFGDRMLDVRIGRWLSVDRLYKNYCYASPYNYALNTPIQAIDPDGERVFFINGYYNTGKLSGLAGAKGGRDYWGGTGYEKAAQGYFKDFAPLTKSNFIDGTGKWNSSGKQRFNAGYEYAKANFDKLTEGMVKGETIKMVTHSMGGAYGEGMTKYFEENGTYAVEKILHLSLADPGEFNMNTKPTTIQVNYMNDAVLFYKNTGENNFNSESDMTGVVENENGNIIDAHAATKFDPNVFKEAADLENIRFEPDPKDRKYVGGLVIEPNPSDANYLPSGNSNGTRFNEVSKKTSNTNERKSSYKQNTFNSTKQAPKYHRVN